MARISKRRIFGRPREEGLPSGRAGDRPTLDATGRRSFSVRKSQGVALVWISLAPRGINGWGCG